MTPSSDRRVAHGPGERSHVVERPRERHRPRSAHAPVGGLEPHDAAAGGGQPDRAARVRAERAVREARAHGGARAARRAAGRVARAPGCLGIPVMGVVAERPERQLREVQAAEGDGAGRLEAAEDRRARVGPEVLGEGGAAGRGSAVPGEEVLVGERHPVERAAGAARLRLGLPDPRRPEGAVGVDPEERVERAARATRCGPGTPPWPRPGRPRASGSWPRAP